MYRQLTKVHSLRNKIIFTNSLIRFKSNKSFSNAKKNNEGPTFKASEGLTPEFMKEFLGDQKGKSFSEYTEADIKNLYKKVEEFAQSEDFEDPRPIQLFAVLCAAIAIVLALIRTRDRLYLELNEELLEDTKNELGEEIMRLRQQREANREQVRNLLRDHPKKLEYMEQVWKQEDESDKKHFAEVHLREVKIPKAEEKRKGRVII